MASRGSCVGSTKAAFCLLLIVSGCASIPGRSLAPARALHHALWVWDRGAAARDPDARSRLFGFAAAHAIDTLYYESAEVVAHDPLALADFLSAAAARRISVELLFADPRWVYPQNQAQAVSLIDKGARFAAGLSGARPTALHFDIEPYRLPEWKAGARNEMDNDYLELLHRIVAVKHGFPVHVDIPFWFYRTQVVAADGVTRPLDRAILATVDGCTIMDYRNTASGSDGIIADGRATLADADSMGKTLFIGVETNPVAPACVTFCGLGAADLRRQLTLVEGSFGADQAFAGTAVEDYRGYRDLAP